MSLPAERFVLYALGDFSLKGGWYLVGLSSPQFGQTSNWLWFSNSAFRSSNTFQKSTASPTTHKPTVKWKGKLIGCVSILIPLWTLIKSLVKPITWWIAFIFCFQCSRCKFINCHCLCSVNWKWFWVPVYTVYKFLTVVGIPNIGKFRLWQIFQKCHYLQFLHSW